MNSNHPANSASRPAERPAGPSLTCPACGAAAALPADSCPQCRFNFRTGQRPPEDDSAGTERARRRVYLVCGLIFVLIASVALSLFFLSPGERDASPAPRTVSTPLSELDDAMDAFQNIAEQPLGQRPGLIIDQAQGVADKASENSRMTDELLAE
ncbi:MAG: hypothetical protein LBS31_06140 [Candidatus Adiutrix sp.]|jgi:hypothetical protein|nr:hypothetical protein [Candidatus Adiutrix sp.]